MRGSQGMRGGSSSSQQPSPLQPAHLRLGSQPESNARQDAARAPPRVLDPCVSQPAPSQHMGSQPGSEAQQDASRPRAKVFDPCVSQPASSQHSLRGNDEPCIHPGATHGPMQEGNLADAADAQRASLVDARVQNSHHASEADAVVEDGFHEQGAADQADTGQQQQAQQQHLTRQAAEHQPWEEAVQLLHSLACQISKRGGTPEQRSQASQPCGSSQQPKHGSQPAGSAPSIQPSSGMEASQGQQTSSWPGHTTSAEVAPSSRNVSHAEGAQQPLNNAAPLGLGHLQASQPRPTEQPSQSCPSTVPPSHSLGIQWTPGSEHSFSQHSAGPSLLSQQLADKSDVQTTHGTSIDVGGPDDLPGARLLCPAPSRDSLDGPILDSRAPRSASQGQPGSTEGTQTTSESRPGAKLKSASTSAEDAGQGSRGTQATQVEGEGHGAGQTELTLCLQLSSEDQDLACGQQPSASLHPTGAPELSHSIPPLPLCHIRMWLHSAHGTTHTKAMLF